MPYVAVSRLRAKKDYLDVFYHIIGKSKYQERIGKYAGFPLRGACVVNRDCKVKPITDYYKNINEAYTQYVGIAIDEPSRLERLKGTNKVSLLAEFGYTEQMAYDLCKKYDLLSPIYKFASRGGCWFCPNCSFRQYADIKQSHPELWRELELLSHEKNTVSRWFRVNKTFNEVNAKVDAIIERQQYEAEQITFEEVLK